ncbi:MAG: LURP-one-related/scramblase family protein [Actinomycetes bacterium]
MKGKAMELRNRGLDGPRFQMREKIMAIGDDFWIEDKDGNRVYKVNGKALRLRETFVLEDANGNELSKIQGKKLSVRNKMTIESGPTRATVHKRLMGIRDHFIIDVEGGEELNAHGNIVDHEYEIERGGDPVATVSKKWFRVREAYGVQIAEGQDVPLILAITVCIGAMARG